MVSSKTVKSYIDSSETYMAISIETSNRYEVQIVQLSTKKVISNFELDSEDQISSISWSKMKTESKSKKRNHNNEKLSSVEKSCYLIVALDQGDILVFSPFQKDIVNKISNDSKIISLFAKDENEFYGLDSSSQVKQFSLLENKTLNSFPFTNDKTLQLIAQHTGDNDFIITSNCLYIVELAKSGFLEISLRLPVPRGHSTLINCIVQSLKNPEILITSRISDNTIHVYSKKANICILKATNNISLLRLVNVSGSEYLIAILENGDIEIFKDFDEKRAKDDELTPSVKISSTTDLENVYSNPQTGLECIWFEDLKPNFSKIDLNKTEIHIEASSKLKTNGVSKPAAVVTTPEEEDDEEEVSKIGIDENDDDDDDDELNVNNKYVVSTSDELYSLLVSAIESLDDEKLIDICKSDNSALNVKQTILKSVTLEQSVILFKALSIRISGQPSDSTNVSKWLKYLLLIHGNNIIKSDDNVAILKLLRSSLLESTKHLPNLVALQGRLQLLKSQLQLRNEMSSLSIEESDDENDEDEDEDVESIYINGEGDEDESSFLDKEALELENGVDEDED